MEKVYRVYPISGYENQKSYWTFNKEVEVGSGAYGAVYQVCKEQDCDYVVKVQKFPENFDSEVELQNKAADIGVSIPILDSWKSDNGYYVIIMEKLDGTVGSLITELKYKGDKKGLYHIGKRLLEMIVSLTSIGICHCDTFSQNVMYKRTKVNKKFDIQDYRLYLIDFGISLYYDDPKVDNEKVEQFQTLYSNFTSRIGSKKLNEVNKCMIEYVVKERDDNMIGTLWKNTWRTVYKVTGRISEKEYSLSSVIPSKTEFEYDTEMYIDTIDEHSIVNNDSFIGIREETGRRAGEFLIDGLECERIGFGSFYRSKR